MICSNVLTELRSWGPALEDVLEGFLGGPGRRKRIWSWGHLGQKEKGREMEEHSGLCEGDGELGWRAV